MQSLSLDLRSNTALVHLSLSLNECPQIDDKAVGMLSLGMKSLKKLVKLTIRLGSCQITDKGVQALSVNLKQCASLSAVNMSFTMCSEISSQAAERLYENLGDVSSLLVRSHGFRRSKGGYSTPKNSELMRGTTDSSPKELGWQISSGCSSPSFLSDYNLVYLLSA